MSDQLLPRDREAEEVHLWFMQALDTVRDRMRAMGYPVDGYNITLRFDKGDILVKVTR
jgi:hypothetical protein